MLSIRDLEYSKKSGKETLLNHERTNGREKAIGSEKQKFLVNCSLGVGGTNLVYAYSRRIDFGRPIAEYDTSYLHHHTIRSQPPLS